MTTYPYYTVRLIDRDGCTMATTERDTMPQAKQAARATT
jgi:hypothetical protein